MSKSLSTILQGYLGMTPKDKGCETWTDMQSKMEEEINALFIQECKAHFKDEVDKFFKEENALWYKFTDVKPEIGQYIKIWWNTDEVTVQVWQDDIVYCGRELPRFWKPLKNQ
jgi:hypothetical protein